MKEQPVIGRSASLAHLPGQLTAVLAAEPELVAAAAGLAVVVTVTVAKAVARAVAGSHRSGPESAGRDPG